MTTTDLPPCRVDEKAREEFAHRYNTVLYEVWNDGWKQGYEQRQDSARQQPTVADLAAMIEKAAQEMPSDLAGTKAGYEYIAQSLIQQKEGR